MDARQKKEIEDIAKQTLEKEFKAMYDKVATKYGVADVPLHKHNGIDAPTIPISSIDGFVALPANSGGVASPGKLNSQIINNSAQGSNLLLSSKSNSATLYSLPISIIYGNEFDANFNGGSAPVGTMILFVNPSNTDVPAQLWIRSNATSTFSGGVVNLNAAIPAPAAYMLTAPLGVGDVSANLVAPWAGMSGVYQFGTSLPEYRYAEFTLGSVLVTWTVPISTVATDVIDVLGASTGTLAIAWPNESGTYYIEFSDGQIFNTTFTQGSTVLGGWFFPISNVTNAVIVTSPTWYGAALSSL